MGVGRVAFHFITNITAIVPAHVNIKNNNIGAHCSNGSHNVASVSYPEHLVAFSFQHLPKEQ